MEPKLPDLHQYPLTDAYDELDLLGFPLCDPFSLVETAAGCVHELHSGSHPRHVQSQRTQPFVVPYSTSTFFPLSVITRSMKR